MEHLEHLHLHTDDGRTLAARAYRPLEGATVQRAVIVAPGGGFMFLSWQHEGTQVCEWLTSIGVTAVLLKYRTPTRDEPEHFTLPVQDAQRSLGIVRHRAAEWGIDPQKIGMVGFSAGGGLVLRLAGGAQAAAAVAAFTGELALIWVGVAPLGMLGVAAEMTKGLAVTRLYIGLASGVAISYIENQGPPPIDLIAVVHDNGEAAGKNLPSFAADYFEARVSELSKNTIILTKQMIRNAFPNYNRVQIKKLQVVASKTTTAATQTVVRQASMTQRAFSVVGYLMAGWQTVESAQKLGTRLDPNLIEEIFY